MHVLSFMRGAAFLLAGAFPLLSRADTLVLSNGDRLSGDVVREENGRLVFRSSVLGEISVPASEATIVTTSEEPVTPAPAATIVTASPAARTIPTITASTAPRSPQADRENEWKRQIELGMSAQDGVLDQRNLSVRLEADRTNADGSVRMELSHHYGKTDGNLVTDATSANATLTHNLNEDLFVRGATRFDRDPVLGLDHDAEQSLGLGYTLLKNSGVNLSVGGGAALRNRDTARTSSSWDGLFDAFGRLKCAFTDRLSLSQDVSVTAAPDNSTDYRLKSQTALVNQLTEMLRMTVRYEFEYNGAALADVPTRQRLVTAIGCVF